MNNKKYKILVVDDDLIIRSMFSDYLGKNGFDVVTAQSAEDGLSLIIKNQPDLVIIDIMMAKMNGWQMLDYIRNDMGIDEITMPVIVMSSVLGSDLEMEYMRHRANDWIAKPIKPMSILLAKIKTILGIDALEKATKEGTQWNSQ
jgi:CheY-like chemotaxis protein